MDVSSVGASALTPEMQALYAIQCIKMAQESTEILGSIIQDTVEVSQEAMEKYLAEIQA